MKKSVLFLLMAIGTISFAKAQKKAPTPTEMTVKSVEALDKRLKLNQTQKTLVYNYTLNMYNEQLALSKKQQAGTFNEDDVTKFYKLKNEATLSIRNILKGDQQTEYDKFLDEPVNGKKKKGKRGKDEEEEVVTGISGLKLPPANP